MLTVDWSVKTFIHQEVGLLDAKSLAVLDSSTSDPQCKNWYFTRAHYRLGGSDAPSNRKPGCGFNPRRGRQNSFMEIDHEIFSMVILSLPLIQEGQLSVSGKRMCTILVNRLED